MRLMVQQQGLPSSLQSYVKARVFAQLQVAADPAAAAAVTRWEDLPSDLRNATAVLEAVNPAAPGGKSKVFLLGVSHVSKVRPCFLSLGSSQLVSSSSTVHVAKSATLQR